MLLWLLVIIQLCINLCNQTIIGYTKGYQAIMFKWYQQNCQKCAMQEALLVGEIVYLYSTKGNTIWSNYYYSRAWLENFVNCWCCNYLPITLVFAILFHYRKNTLLSRNKNFWQWLLQFGEQLEHIIYYKNLVVASWFD